MNLKQLNNYLMYKHFKMKGDHSVKDLIPKSDWMTKKDMTNAYLTVQCLVHHQKYLQIQCQRKTYQFQKLPFVISVSQLVFIKLMKVQAIV